MDVPKRVLHVVSSMDRGGAETLIMNVYRHLDRQKVQFDFITHSDKTDDFDQEIIELGGNVYKIPSLGTSGPIRYLRDLIKVMSLNKYVAVHAHTDFQSGFPALAAKICKINHRICHSHSNNWMKKGFKGYVILKALQLLIKISATKLCSCSEEAATFLFGKHFNKVEILKNGVNINEFLQAETDSRERVLEELSIPSSSKIIGHIGRFSESKNHLFLLKVLKKMIKRDPNFIVLLVGEGPLRHTIELEAERLNLQKHVKFLGVRSDIPKLMKTFDIFLFPSKFEGFGIVLLEAQCAGTPCLVANNVPKATDMGLGLVTYLPIEDSEDKWCDSLLHSLSIKKPNRNIIFKNVSNLGFDIKDNVNEWIKLYGLGST
ncbi:glycosyltransferase family 1 protein [Lederbergia wuyishanensis]|uniref:Glycosyltransferase EpsF n=1 Tax=Lederbergia wuyishanensis TaxID=1347903 RepID=A0ABU0D7W5_9BACI|nr:glycosyltransferase family 1 protein [Lederbergia wuyishanensis]MCJ8009121.1 glycosyltransferase family 1 protein [Lederbergia wuyishanensis]MDQ0344460.1 glycosyltransferase EpsF [Lederbergia wuyishanensis]